MGSVPEMLTRFPSESSIHTAPSNIFEIIIFAKFEKILIMVDCSYTVGIWLSDTSGNQMANSSPIAKLFVIQVTIWLPDKKSDTAGIWTPN